MEDRYEVERGVYGYDGLILQADVFFLTAGVHFSIPL